MVFLLAIFIIIPFLLSVCAFFISLPHIHTNKVKIRNLILLQGCGAAINMLGAVSAPALYKIYIEIFFVICCISLQYLLHLNFTP